MPPSSRQKTETTTAGADKPDLQLGERLKMVRKSKGLSQRELAKRSGITNATISLIEQNAHAPSVVSLHKILTAIPMSLADFFALPVSTDPVLFYDADDMTAIVRGDTDLRCMASERPEKNLQMFFEHYAPGAGTGEEMISHDGETAAVVVKGVVEVVVEGERRRIAEGGGFQVFGPQPYRLLNVGEEEAIVACAVTPPIF